MALSNTQYDSIIHEYDVARLSNHHLLEQRREYVYENVEGYKELDSSVVSVSLDYARKKLAGEEDSLEELHALLDDLHSMKASLLKGAGLPEDYLEPIYNCPDCKDTGYIGREKCHCFKGRITSILYDQSNIREFLKDNNFSKLSYAYYQGEDLDRFKKAEETCHDMIDDFSNEKKSLLFYGTVGIGKSFLSGCVAQELIEKGYSCFYYSAIELFAQISKETFHTSQKDDLYNLLDYLYNCDLLIIDDLGTENTNSFVSSQLFSIINERSLRKRSTIISTNLSLQELRERYSDRVFSRIVTSFNIVHLSGNDIRIAKRTSTS